MSDTPLLLNGKMAVVIHLLSPAGRPLQVNLLTLLLSSALPRRYLNCRFRSEAVFVTSRRFHSIWRQEFNTPLLAPWPRKTLTL